MRRIAQNEVLKAIKDSGGIMTTIARRLNCNWNTARTYCDKWESTKQALKEEKETTLDLAEIEILKAIKEGNLNIIKWYLSTIGKERGYTDDIKDDTQTQELDPLHIIFEDKEGKELFNADNVEIGP